MERDHATIGDAGSATFAEREVSKSLPYATRRARSEAGSESLSRRRHFIHHAVIP